MSHNRSFTFTNFKIYKLFAKWRTQTLESLVCKSVLSAILEQYWHVAGSLHALLPAGVFFMRLRQTCREAEGTPVVSHEIATELQGG